MKVEVVGDVVVEVGDVVGGVFKSVVMWVC